MHAQKIVLLLGSLAIAGLIVPACSNSKERIIQEKVAERVADFRQKKATECREKLLTDAEKMVDSILLYEALSEVNDSLRRSQPFKPLPPAAIDPLDSGAVKPIFDH